MFEGGIVVLLPWGYGTSFKSSEDTRAVLLQHYHPEFVERFMAWLKSHVGKFGVGGHWRAGGTQPDRVGFAPEGKSFHQNQAYADGFVGACAVDVVAVNPGGVHRSPTWSEVPAQGSEEALRWGVHMNVGAAPGGEPWHCQPVEIDGWQSWWDKGRPAPRPNYSFPGRFVKGVVVDRFRFEKGRVFDSRRVGAMGRLQSGNTVQVSAPALAKGVKCNVTVTDCEGSGYVTVFPGGSEPAGTSDVNYQQGVTVANQVDCPVGANGEVQFRVMGAACHLVVDVVGWWE